MRRHRLILALLVMALTVAGLPAQASAGGRHKPAKPEQPEYVINQAQVDGEIARVEAATGQDVLSGEIAGAAWIGQIPDNWNGNLVIYAHGYRGEGLELTVDPPPEFEFLTEQGYAWAASSYRRNSYDPGIAVRDTRNVTNTMKRILRKNYDRVDNVYLAGVSMGGHVTAASIERYPNLYDGALPVCGVMGDVELFDYFLDYNVGAAAFAGLEPDYEYPSDTWLADTVPSVKEGLSTDPGGIWAGGFDQIFGAPTPLTPAGESFKDFVEVGSGGERVTFDAAWNFWHGLADPSGNFFFGLGNGDGTIANRRGIVSQNTDMTYLDEYGVDIDDDVVRIEAARYVRRGNGSPAAPIIKGKPRVPVLSLHTTGDLFVPIEMQQIYAQEMQDNGRGHLLVQRAIRDVGHCSFTSAEYQQAYTDLFNWVENGERPAGEDLIGDISSPDLGCAFTTGEVGSGFRDFLEPCA